MLEPFLLCGRFARSTTEIIEGDDTLEVSIVEARGFGDNLNNTDAWVDIVAEIDRRYDEYLQKEFAPSGTAGVVDPRIHACLYFVAPLAAGLRTLDVAFMKAIDGKVNLIPVIAKADAFTPTELAAFKAQVLREIDDHRIQIYRPTASSDALPDWAARQLRKIPYAVVGSNDIVDVDGYQYRGRKYPWGEVLVEEPDAFHDFLVLRSLLIEESLVTLKDETNRKHYEAYRKERLEKVGYDNYAKNIKLFCDKEMDISKLDAKREEAMAALKQKVASKEKKISEAEEEIMLKYRDIMQELSEKRKKYELKLKAYM